MRTNALDIPDLPAALVLAIRDQIPQVAAITVATVAAQVPAYAPATRDPYREELQTGVRMAFEGFAGLLASPEEASLERITRAARYLGRTEARRRRGIGALLTAYQVGTGVHWQEVSALALAHGLDATEMAQLAALIFAYNEQLSAASVEGYAAETQTRERHREDLARALLAGEVSKGQIERARWTAPETLTCVLLDQCHANSVLLAYPDSVQVALDEVVVVLVPDVTRAALLGAVAGTDAVIGPSVAWRRAHLSYERARAMADLVADRPLDTDGHLVELILSAAAREDLRAQVLEPLAGNERLMETLRSWLLHAGRRDAVAADLFVHPQTVRYRMGQIRAAYGDRLNDPREVLKLVVALG